MSLKELTLLRSKFYLTHEAKHEVIWRVGNSEKYLFQRVEICNIFSASSVCFFIACICLGLPSLKQNLLLRLSRALSVCVHRDTCTLLSWARSKISRLLRIFCVAACLACLCFWVHCESPPVLCACVYHILMFHLKLQNQPSVTQEKPVHFSRTWPHTILLE